MPAQSCKTCRWARFRRTERISSKWVGQCAHPVDLSTLPCWVVSYAIPAMNWVRPDDGATCPVYEAAKLKEKL